MAVQTQATRFVWAFSLLVACGDSVTVNGVVKGALGESCRARNDCDEGLFCRDLVCTNASPAQGADGGTVGSSRGDRGESCQRRDDCQASLACIGNVCTDAPLDAGTLDFSSSGKRGEDCEATRDCAAGLVCVNARCRESDFGLDYTPKLCDIVECAANADCCKSFDEQRYYTADQCAAMKTTCEAGAVSVSPPYECSTYRTYCLCPTVCDQEACRAQTGVSCLIASECTSAGYAGGCVNGRCAQCKTNDQCTGAGQTCVAGICQLAGCTLNEHCGIFEACQSGKCVDVGCASDRECYFDTGNPRAKCKDKKCTSPCETDAECGSSFTICNAGNCQFVGCNTDEECRIEQDLTMQTSTSSKRAVCREPKL